jgi:hypothetical protein
VLIDQISAAAVHEAATLVRLAVDFGKIAAIAPENLGEVYQEAGQSRL